MRRAIVIEIECDEETYSVKDIEKGMACAIKDYFNDTVQADEHVDVLHLECADGSLKEKFGVGL